MNPDAKTCRTKETHSKTSIESSNIPHLVILKADISFCHLSSFFLKSCVYLPASLSLQDAFEVLAQNCEFSENEGPCLAFRRAASVLKSLPRAVERPGAIQDVPCLGERTKAVIEVRPKPGCITST